MERVRLRKGLFSFYSQKKRRKSSPSMVCVLSILKWLKRPKTNFLPSPIYSRSPINSKAGTKPRQNTLAMTVFILRRLSTSSSDQSYPSSDSSRTSPPCPLGPVGNPVRRLDVCDAAIAHSSGGDLSGWIKGRTGDTLAFHLHADRLERFKTNALDIGFNGCDQRHHGNLDGLCPGPL